MYGSQTPVGQMLVVRAGRKINPLPLLRQVRGLGTTDQEAVEKRWEGLPVEQPRAPRIKALSEKEEATPAALAFLREAKVGEVVSLVALEGGEDPVEAGGEEGGAGPP